jgi:hypothetical protein
MDVWVCLFAFFQVIHPRNLTKNKCVSKKNGGKKGEICVRWCDINGYHSMNHNNFGVEIKRTFSSVQKDQRRTGNSRISIYQGLNVMEGSEFASETNERVNIVSVGSSNFSMRR